MVHIILMHTIIRLICSSHKPNVRHSGSAHPHLEISRMGEVGTVAADLVKDVSTHDGLRRPKKISPLFADSGNPAVSLPDDPIPGNRARRRRLGTSEVY